MPKISGFCHKLRIIDAYKTKHKRHKKLRVLGSKLALVVKSKIMITYVAVQFKC